MPQGQLQTTRTNKQKPLSPLEIENSLTQFLKVSTNIPQRILFILVTAKSILSEITGQGKLGPALLVNIVLRILPAE